MVRTAGRDAEQGDVLCGVREVGKESQHPSVCPMEVLDNEHERLDGRHHLNEPPPGGEDLHLVALDDRSCLAGAHERADATTYPVPLTTIRNQRCQRYSQLLAGRLRAVGLANTALLLDDLAVPAQAAASRA